MATSPSFMKKYLLILLLIVLPFQFSWAAAAAYCQHEQGAATHFGHHGHQHKVHGNKADVSKTADKFHGDCESCHLFSHVSLISAAAEPAHCAAQDHLLPLTRDYRSHIPAPPKRPDWLPVA